MASGDERTPRFLPLDEQDEQQRNDSMPFGFEQELKSITLRQGDSARFEAKIYFSSSATIDRALINVEWRLNDVRITSDDNPRYRFDSLSDEHLYRMDIRQCEQDDEGVYTIYISYDHERYHDESSAYLFVDSESNQRVGVGVLCRLTRGANRLETKLILLGEEDRCRRRRRNSFQRCSLLVPIDRLDLAADDVRDFFSRTCVDTTKYVA